MAGNSATKNLNAIEEALVVMAPFIKPLMKNRSTSDKGNPSKPGNTIRSNKIIKILTILEFLIFL